jgi:hypothetical protein
MYKKGSIRLSVCALLPADIAPRELKFSTEVRWCVRLNSTVLDFWIRGL